MSRRLSLAVLISVVLHLAGLFVLLFVVPREPPPIAPPDKPAEVELVLVEQKGVNETQAPQSPAPQTEVPPDEHATEPPPAAEEKPTEPPPPAEQPPEQPAEPLPVPPVPTPPRPATPPPRPAPPVLAAPKPAPAMEFNLGGTDSESNAIVTGDHVIPAAPDKKARNRPPAYPEESARRGEHGAVLVVIHVTTDGSIGGVEIMRSSGYRLLDRSAVDAVQTWHFVPAVKDGEPVPFDMPMRFVFELH